MAQDRDKPFVGAAGLCQGMSGRHCSVLRRYAPAKRLGLKREVGCQPQLLFYRYPQRPNSAKNVYELAK